MMVFARASQASDAVALRMVAVFIAGALAVLALPPVSILISVPIAWSALFVLVHGRGIGTAFCLGWSFGMSHFAFGLWWITESFMVDPDKFGVFAIPAVLGLAAFLSVFPAMAMTVFAYLRVRGPVAAVAFAACWAAAEWLRGHVFTGFPWNLAGYALVDYAAPRQTAALVGSYGLSFVTILVAVLPAAVIHSARREKIVAVVFLLGLTGSAWIFGEMRLAAPEPALSGTHIRVVQGNVPQREKWQASRRNEIVARYLALSARPGAPDLVLWPESAFPGLLDEDKAAQRRILQALPQGVLLLTGVPDREHDGSQTRYYNAVQAYAHRYGLVATYAKHHLVPFGEYVPFRDWLPFDRIVGGVADFSSGPGPRTLALSGIPLVGVAICYEVIFPGHVVDNTARPDWIFNATNDAWFGVSIGPEQHLASAQMRAVEEGLPIVRAANTGISAVIDAKGRVLARLEMNQTGTIDTGLPGPLRRTLYSRVSDWIVPPLIALTWLLIMMAPRRPRH